MVNLPRIFQPCDVDALGLGILIKCAFCSEIVNNSLDKSD